jgi:hypothetical protein
MEKRGVGLIALVLALFLVVGVVHADWDDFVEDEEINNNDVLVQNNSADDDFVVPISQKPSDVFDSRIDPDAEMGDMEYTIEFYIALGVFLVAVLVILYLVYSFLKKPKNKWDK